MKSYLEDYQKKLAIILKNIKYIIEKSFFGQTKMEYLGFWVMKELLIPANNSGKAIKNMILPMNKRR